MIRSPDRLFPERPTELFPGDGVDGDSPTGNCNPGLVFFQHPRPLQKDILSLYERRPRP